MPWRPGSTFLLLGRPMGLAHLLFAFTPRGLQMWPLPRSEYLRVGCWRAYCCELAPDPQSEVSSGPGHACRLACMSARFSPKQDAKEIKGTEKTKKERPNDREEWEDKLVPWYRFRSTRTALFSCHFSCCHHSCCRTRSVRGRRHSNVAPTNRRGRAVGCRRARSALADPPPHLLRSPPRTQPSQTGIILPTGSGLISCMSAVCVLPLQPATHRSQGGESEVQMYSFASTKTSTI